MSEFNRLTDNPDVRIRPEILKLEARVRRNIARRKLALDQGNFMLNLRLLSNLKYDFLFMCNI